MEYQTIILSTQDNIATLTLNRPDKLNAFDARMEAEVADALDRVDNDDESRMLVITGAGRAFCAGVDLDSLPGSGVVPSSTVTADISAAEAARRRLNRSSGIILPKLQKMIKPTIAMVNGPAVGAGCDFAFGCDLRIGSEKARFMSAFVRVGLFSGWGGTWLFPRLMGVGKALEYLFTGDYMEAKEAEKLGVLNRLVPAADLVSETMALAERIANGPPIAIRLTKLMVYKGLAMDMETALQMAAACESITLTSEDHREGIAAFREKRKPKFQGK